MAAPFFQQIRVDLGGTQPVAETNYTMPSQQLPSQQLPSQQFYYSPHQPLFQPLAQHPLVSAAQQVAPAPQIPLAAAPQGAGTQFVPQSTAPQAMMDLNQSMAANPTAGGSAGFAPGTLPGVSSGAPGLSSSPEALMNALNLLQQNIGALQSLIPLMAQQQQQQPADAAHAEQLKQQQAAASHGIASVISQLALAAANILPQMGLSPPANVTCGAVTQSANVTSGNVQSGQFPSSAQQPYPNVASLSPPNPHNHGVYSHLLTRQQEEPRQATIAETRQQAWQLQQHQPIPENNPQEIGSQENGSQWNGSGPQLLQLGLATSPPVIPQPLKDQQPQQQLHMHQRQQQQEQQLEHPMPPQQQQSSPVSQQAAAKRKNPEPAVSPAAAGEEEDDDGETFADGEFDIVQMDPVELLAEHTHFCEICGKGFKRDANLRMHMRGHGDEYKTPEALARPDKHKQQLQHLGDNNNTTGAGTSPTGISSPPVKKRPKRFSCPFAGCKRNSQHARFLPLKTMLCVKNHYRRNHCPKMLACSKCGAKRFSVVADLKTHEKHCGRDRWLCSCGTSFSRKDKLLGHLTLFKGHRTATALTTDAAATAAAAVGATGAAAAVGATGAAAAAAIRNCATAAAAGVTPSAAASAVAAGRVGAAPEASAASSCGEGGGVGGGGGDEQLECAVSTFDLAGRPLFHKGSDEQEVVVYSHQHQRTQQHPQPHTQQRTQQHPEYQLQQHLPSHLTTADLLGSAENAARLVL